MTLKHQFSRRHPFVSSYDTAQTCRHCGLEPLHPDHFPVEGNRVEPAVEPQHR